MTDNHTYPAPDDEEGFLYVREWEDQQLQEEFQFLAGLFAAAAGEVAFRADHPEHRDGTGEIKAIDAAYYDLSDEVNRAVTRGDAFYDYDPFADRDGEESEEVGDWFQVFLCPHCERTTVVDTRYDEHRCDWSDTCGELFDLEDALESEKTMADL